MNILVLNSGSSSIKYQLFDTATEATLAQGIFEELDSDEAFASAIANSVAISNKHAIHAVGHRVVHGGDAFRDAVIINDEVLEQIAIWIPFAPLHNPRNLAGITTCMQELPDIPHVAVFDTAFHASLPRRASSYAIDPELAHKHSIRRYGFHGTSHEYVATEAAAFLGRPLAELRIISLHLGNGASACAVEYGHSTETSMGMTPLEGLVMGTRSGDIDAGVLLALLRNELDEDVDALDRLLNRQSGLLGLSGKSNDLRQLETHAAQGDDRSRLAIAVFAHQARKYIGAFAVAMGGVDAVVLTGGIGENSTSMRGRILQRLDFLGLRMDEDLNQQALVSHDNKVVLISDAASRVKAMVVKTNEELMIARQADALISQQQLIDPPPIPVAVSARHIHLDKATFAALFGAHAVPTPYKDLSQPRQFACEEVVSLIGPRGRIDEVRLLGPLRSKNQVEVSRTDEYLLGVDAPVRDSGKVENSAPITLEGPLGRVHLEEGLICARRHIHMHTDDAKRFGVKNRDEVEVAITGGVRDLVFGDVLVRVSPGYRLEMHIDTDEANAAELTRGTSGTLVYTLLDNACAELRARSTRKIS